FYEDLARRGFDAGRTANYPRNARACDANRMNAFVVDPDGDLYKCWTEIGNKAASIGTIRDLKGSNHEEGDREVRWLTWEPFEYSDCVECKMLPICMGGCGCQAMFLNNGRPECKEWKYSLEHYVRSRFAFEKNLKETVNQAE